MEFNTLPSIEQKQRRPMDGPQFHPPWAGEADGGLAIERNPPYIADFGSYWNSDLAFQA
jgi:hypothetical protein